MKESANNLLETALGEPEPQPTVSEFVASRLRELILTGKLPPGTRLRLTHVAGRFGVSAMPVREAIKILEAERLVTQEPRRGASVASLTVEDIEELMAVRGALESLAAKHGAMRIDAIGGAAMRVEYAAMREASDSRDPASLLAHDRRFHSILYESAGRPTLLARINELLESERRTGDPYVFRDWYPLANIIESHRLILEAVEGNEPGRVASLVAESISTALELTLRAFEEDRQRVLAGKRDGLDWARPDAEVRA